MLTRLWKRLKMVRKLRLGPASVVFYFERAIAIQRAQLGASAAGDLPTGPAVAMRLGPASARPFAAEEQGAPSEASVDNLALIVGAGPGLGAALAERLARDGAVLALASRNAQRLEMLAAQIRSGGTSVAAYACDATSELSVEGLFKQVVRQQGVPTLVVYALQEFGRGRTIEVEAPAFESAWRHNCFGAFLIGRAAARVMSAAGRGTIVFVGSTSSLIGREDHLNLAVGKFGQRALAQVLSREMWSSGVHVAHLTIDADIREGDRAGWPQAEPADIAAAILYLHRQPRSAWTSELDIRPWNERFWEHC